MNKIIIGKNFVATNVLVEGFTKHFATPRDTSINKVVKVGTPHNYTLQRDDRVIEVRTHSILDANGVLCDQLYEIPVAEVTPTEALELMLDGEKVFGFYLFSAVMKTVLAELGEDEIEVETLVDDDSVFVFRPESKTVWHLTGTNSSCLSFPSEEEVVMEPDNVHQVFLNIAARKAAMWNSQLIIFISDYLNAGNPYAGKGTPDVQRVHSAVDYNLSTISKKSWMVMDTSLQKCDLMFSTDSPSEDPMSALKQLASGKDLNDYRLFSQIILDHMSEMDGKSDDLQLEEDPSTVYRVDPSLKTITVLTDDEVKTTLLF